jgi:TonB family protein
MTFSSHLSALASVLLMASCGITVPIVIGPADLDDKSLEAPRCGPQQYPFMALTHAESGTVVVSTKVLPSGSVVGTSVLVSTSNQHLNEAAAESVRSCQFPQTPTDGVRQINVTVVYAIVSIDDKLPKGAVRIGIRRGP